MTIRLASEHDAEAIRAIYAPHVEGIASFELEVPSVEAIAGRIDTTQERTPWLVFVDDGAVVGYAYAGPYRSRDAYRWSCETSAYVAESHHRRGIARKLYGALFAALERQGFVNLYAGITLPNDKSVSFHRSMGFEPIGVYRGVGFKHGAWRDVAWSAKTLRRPKAPEPPHMLPAVRHEITDLVAQFDADGVGR